MNISLKDLHRLIRASLGSFAILIMFAVGITTSAQETEEAQPTEPTVQVIVDGEAQIVEGFADSEKWIEHYLWVETEFDTDGDGRLDRMHVDVTRPEQTDTEDLKVATIYNTSPYFAGTASPVHGFMWDPNHELGEVPPTRTPAPQVETKEQIPYISRSMVGTWVPRGFAVVHSSSPGTGLSQGSPTVGGENESLAPKAVVDWLCGRAKGYTSPDGDEEVVAYWSMGKVGMTGTSYNGTLPVACATTGVEGLEAIIPVAPNTSYYHYYRSNGLVRHPGGYMGEDIDVLYDFIHSGDPESRAYANRTVRDTEMAENQDRVTGDYNEFWAGRDYLNEMEPFRAALLMSHGFNDWNVMPEHSERIYQAAKEKGVPTMIYYHQGGHGGPPPHSMMNRWFTRYLLGVENGVEDEPRSWIVRENDSRQEPTPYAEYPHPDASPVSLYMASSGSQQGTLLATQAAEQGEQTLVDDVSINGADLAQAAESENRLLFVTPELTESIHISGTARITIRAASSKPAVNLSVWLVSLPWNTEGRPKITDNIITRSWADLQNCDSLTESEPLEPGEFYEMTFNLQPDDQVIPAGQQIGLMIFASDADFTLKPEAGTELTVDLDGTSLDLPVVGGLAAFQEATK